MKKKTKKEWEEIGLLSNIPEDRKDKVVNALNLIVDAMVGDIVEVETRPVPVIMRIVCEVDVPNEDIPRLFNEILGEYNNHDFEKDKAEHEHMNLDYESMFLTKIADMKIKEYKQK